MDVKPAGVGLVVGLMLLVPFAVKVGLEAVGKAVELFNLYIGALMHEPVIVMAWTGVALIILTAFAGAMAEGPYHDDRGRPPMY